MNPTSAASGDTTGTTTAAPKILYCHCRYAQVVPANVKNDVLRRLCESQAPFEAVPDLCELSARKDPALATIVRDGAVKIAACYPRAVKWLFAAAGHPLVASQTEVLNMRTQPSAEIAEALTSGQLRPNLPLDHTPPSASASQPANNAI